MFLNLGIGIIGLLTVVTYAIVVGGGSAGLIALHLAVNYPSIIAWLFGTAAVLSFIVMVAVLSTIGAIAKAALYYYATTGEAPANFNSQLLHAAMTPKKARRVFA